MTHYPPQKFNLPSEITRRGFLATGLRLLLAGSVSTAALRAAATDLARFESPTEESPGMPWRVVEAVQEHLLPSEPGIPGARDVNATGFLRLLMTNPLLETSDRNFIEQGATEFVALCHAQFGQGFLDLKVDQRQQALRRFEQSHTGHVWLAEMLEFLMEALLGDPSHGGNPEGTGWKWLGITPGFPRPPLTPLGQDPK